MGSDLLKSPIFISGPMSGYEEWNFPAFHAAEAKLQAEGYEVISPAREFEGIDPESVSWEDCMRIAMRHLTDAKTLVVLPFWSDSRGAMLEVLNAKKLGMRIIDHETGIDLTDKLQFDLTLTVL